MSGGTVTISDFGRVVTGKTPSTKNSSFFDGEYQFVTPSDLDWKTYYCRTTERTVTDNARKSYLNQFIPVNAVMVTCIGNTIGKCGLSSAGCLTNQQINSIIPNDGIEPRFVYYLLVHNTDTIRGVGLGGGSATPILNKTSFSKIKLRVPPSHYWSSISNILSAYDDLIENNRRRIQLLEQAARLLYREWFVHLRFPGHEHVKVTDGVPEGWERRTYSDLFKFLGGFAFKSKTYQSDGKYGIVTIKNVHDARFVPECPSRLDTPPEKMKDHCFLKTGDILMSLTGNIGRVCIVYGNNFLLNQRVAKVIEEDNIPRSFIYWTFSNKETQRKLENLAYGVAQLNLSPVKLGEQEFVRPPDMLLDMFSDITEPMFSQICLLNLQNRKAEQARDLLLSRLMNGELAV